MDNNNEKTMVEFAKEFPGVMKVEENSNGCVYVKLKKLHGVPEGFFSGMRYKYELSIIRIDDEKTGTRITFK